MCGGFVMAYSSAKIAPSSPSFHQLMCHFIYNIGRVSSYTLLGLLFGLLGSIISFSAQSSGYFYFITGIVMVLMGLSLMGKIKFLTSLESSLAFSPFIKKLFSKLIHSRTYISFYGLGVLNGFLPCGLVYFFLASAAASGSALWGAVIMLIFGLSTVPALLGLGFMVGFLHGNGLRETMIKLASFIVIAYGIYMAYLGYRAVIA